MITVIKHNRPVKIKDFKRKGLRYYLYILINKIKKNEIGVIEWEI